MKDLQHFIITFLQYLHIAEIGETRQLQDTLSSAFQKHWQLFICILVDLWWVYTSTISKRSDKQWIRFKEGGGNLRWPDYVSRNELTIGGLIIFNLYNTKQVGGGGRGQNPPSGSSLCCAETVSSRKLKLSDFYYILIGFHLNTNQSHGTSTFAMTILLLKSAWYNFGKIRKEISFFSSQNVF